MPEEANYFEGGEIVVTSARFIAGAETFAIRGITSVKGVETPQSLIGPVGLILVGIALIVGAGAASEFLMGLFGVLFIAGGAVLFSGRKTVYSIVLTTAAGEVTAYESKDRKFISEVIKAVNRSIVSNSQG